MSIDRIFAELQSRRFKFVVNGENFSLPHLSSLKSELQEIPSLSDASITKVARLLFKNEGEHFQEMWMELSMRDLKKLIEEWGKWSGFSLGKSYGRGK